MQSDEHLLHLHNRRRVARAAVVAQRFIVVHAAAAAQVDVVPAAAAIDGAAVAHIDVARRRVDAPAATAPKIAIVGAAHVQVKIVRNIAAIAALSRTGKSSRAIEIDRTVGGVNYQISAAIAAATAIVTGIQSIRTARSATDIAQVRASRGN